MAGEGRRKWGLWDEPGYARVKVAWRLRHEGGLSVEPPRLPNAGQLDESRIASGRIVRPANLYSLIPIREAMHTRHFGPESPIRK